MEEMSVAAYRRVNSIHRIGEEPFFRKEVTMSLSNQPLNLEIYYKRGLIGISIVLLGVIAVKVGWINLDSFALQVVFLHLAVLAGISATWSG